MLFWVLGWVLNHLWVIREVGSDGDMFEFVRTLKLWVIEFVDSLGETNSLGNTNPLWISELETTWFIGKDKLVVY